MSDNEGFTSASDLRLTRPKFRAHWAPSKVPKDQSMRFQETVPRHQGHPLQGRLPKVGLGRRCPELLAETSVRSRLILRHSSQLAQM